MARPCRRCVFEKKIQAVPDAQDRAMVAPLVRETMAGK